MAAFNNVIQAPTNVGRPVESLNSTAPLFTPLRETTLVRDCGRNCSYTVSFVAPAVKCADNNVWNTAFTAPNATAAANTTIVTNGTTVTWTSAKQFLGKSYYRAERPPGTHLLWVGFVPSVDLGNRVPRVLVCRNSIARYTVRLDVQNHHFLEPTIAAVETLSMAPDTLPDFPTTLYLPNQALSTVIADTLIGRLTPGALRASDVTLTTLFESVTNISPDLGFSIERMAEKMTVSLLSIDGSGVRGSGPLLLEAAVEPNKCITTTQIAVYTYAALRLVLVYAGSVGVVMVMAVVGFVALGCNGVAYSVSVSTVLRTTRNPTLDHLVGEGCLGGGSVPAELGKLKLKFGEIGEGGHVAMGIEGEVRKIQRGGRYS